MNPGELRHRIIIQKPDNTQDSFGEPTEVWSDVCSVWASVNPLVGKQYFAAESVQSEITHKIKLRYRRGITPDMQVLFKGRYFSIVSVINYQERNTELQLMCRELI